MSVFLRLLRVVGFTIGLAVTVYCLAVILGAGFVDGVEAALSQRSLIITETRSAPPPHRPAAPRPQRLPLTDL